MISGVMFILLGEAILAASLPLFIWLADFVAARMPDRSCFLGSSRALSLVLWDP